MQEMLEYIVKNLVSNPEAVEISAENQGKTKVFKVKVDAKDLGNVIGRGGSIANAIRTVVRSTGGKERLVIKFDEK
ncbi:MAG: KH domain-containing protein [Clostridia bacterium]